MSGLFSKLVFGFLFFTSLNAFSAVGIACDPNASDVELAKTLDLEGAVEVEEGSNLEIIRILRLHPNDVIYQDFEQLLMNENYRVISSVFYSHDELEIAFAVVQNIDSCQLELGLFEEKISFAAITDIEQNMLKVRSVSSRVRFTKVGP